MHRDDIRGRKWSLVCPLSVPDTYQGGALVFPELGISVRAGAGTAIVFDAHLLHGVHPVTKGRSLARKHLRPGRSEVEGRLPLRDEQAANFPAIRLLDMEHAAKMAARRQEFERGKLPLFAEQIPLTPAETILDGYQHDKEAWDRHERTMIAKAHAFRRAVLKIEGIEKTEALDVYRWKTFPPTAVYGASFWRDELKKRYWPKASAK